MTLIDAERRNEIRKLIQLKSGVDEKYLHKKEEGLDKWITVLFEFLERNKNNLGVCRTDNSLLNDFFLKMVNGNAHN